MASDALAADVANAQLAPDVANAPLSAAPPLPLSRLVGVGLVVFLANAALLVLQLASSRLLDPYVGSSLETWTSVIGVFLAGIALGNGFGGRLADRFPSPRTLAALLGAGAIAAVWMTVFPTILSATGAYKSIPLGPRIPLLAIVLCLPAGLVLSLLTPLAIKLGLPDLSRTGRVVGLIFSLSTLGCILGNYLTGFVLIPSFYINTLVYFAAGALAGLAVLSMVVMGGRTGVAESPVPESCSSPQPPAQQHASSEPASSVANPYAFADIRIAYAIVFFASFAGMTLELTASRVLAQFLGVSLFTWTGVIGVMLAGTALGNFTGGVIADRVNRSGSGSGSVNPRHALAGSLLMGGAFTVFQFVVEAVVSQSIEFNSIDVILRVIAWTFSLFFLPMFALGTISPQVIRLAVPDVAHVGRVAGRVYAWSTTGAIVGTFTTGYFLLSAIGMNNTLLLVALVLAFTSLLVANVWNSNPLLYVFSIVLGGITGGLILTYRADMRQKHLIARLETNYYTITVTDALDENNQSTGKLNLTLDHLIHSCVDPEDPFFLHYTHEYVQMEFVRQARQAAAQPRVLVVGGGGYTFPRYAMEVMPETRMDVVEIDPGVTWMARNHLNLKDYPGLSIQHMDGRQYVSERVAPGTYDLVIQDAVNDLSVPAHLLTKEYNDAVKASLKPDGVFLLTVIDEIKYGQLWKAAMHTLQQTFPPENVVLLAPGKSVDVDQRQVYVIYASARPFDEAALHDIIVTQTLGDRMDVAGVPFAAAAGSPGAAGAMAAATKVHTHQVPPEAIQPYLDAAPVVVLTDQYAPVDNLMAEVYRYRTRTRPKP